MEKPKIKTLKALQKTEYQPESIQKELARNLRKKLEKEKAPSRDLSVMKTR